jgi:hypothetical protein
MTTAFENLRKVTCSLALVAAYGKRPNYNNIRVQYCERQNWSVVAAGNVHECRASELP